MDTVVDTLLNDRDPALRYKTLLGVLGKAAGSSEAVHTQRLLPSSHAVQCLLSERDANGQLSHHSYKKWTGAHWVLSVLADLGYPPGDSSLVPLREQVYSWLLPDLGQPHPYRKKLVLEGRVRTCASQEGNALYALVALGLADERIDLLIHGLLEWQWPDGGWNCDKNPAACHSSFHETITPLRGLVWYARSAGSVAAREAADRAAEVFLARGLFRRLSDGEVIDREFVKLHYPCYWHYDVLFGLKVMAEGGWIGDRRCSEALDLLESKRLPDGGFPAEGSFYRPVPARPTRARGQELYGSQTSLFNWRREKKGQMNLWVTADALSVLKAAGRI